MERRRWYTDFKASPLRRAPIWSQPLRDPKESRPGEASPAASKTASIEIEGEEAERGGRGTSSTISTSALPTQVNSDKRSGRTISREEWRMEEDEDENDTDEEGKDEDDDEKEEANEETGKGEGKDTEDEDEDGNDDERVEIMWEGSLWKLQNCSKSE